MYLCVCMFEEVCDDIGAVPIRMLGLKSECRIFLVTLRWKAYVIKLDLVDARLRGFLRQRDVIVLDLQVRGIRPNQLAILTPRLAGTMRLDRQLRMCCHQVLV